jgi:Alpha/beta hydrolase family
LVHGTTADHSRWDTVLPELGAHFRVYTMDRRGRGESGDAEPYRVEAEFDDVAAVVDSIGGDVSVLGHSYGALCPTCRPLNSKLRFPTPTPPSCRANNTSRWIPASRISSTPCSSFLDVPG